MHRLRPIRRRYISGVHQKVFFLSQSKHLIEESSSGKGNMELNSILRNQ